VAHVDQPLQQNQYITPGKFDIPRVKVTSGIEGETFDVTFDAPLPTATQTLPLAIQRGICADAQEMDIYGRNPDIGTTEEDIWAAGGTKTLLDSASNIRFVSTSVNDDATGSGARTGLLTGLDEFYNEISETIILDGTTPVDSVKSYLRVHTFIIQTVGAGGTLAGNLTITAVTGGTVQGYLDAGTNETRLTHRAIPSGKTGYIFRYYMNSFASTAKVATIRLLVKEHRTDGTTAPYVVIRELDIKDEHLIIDLPWLRVPEKADIVMRAVSGATNTVIAGGYDILLLNE
jgi:hypothetical protein